MYVLVVCEWGMRYAVWARVCPLFVLGSGAARRSLHAAPIHFFSIKVRETPSPFVLPVSACDCCCCDVVVARVGRPSITLRVSVGHFYTA